MWHDLLLAAGTALLSSLLTLGLAYWLFRRFLKPRLDQAYEQRLEQAREELGAALEQRMRQGVADGIRDGVSSLPSKETLQGTARTVAKAGAELVGDSLDLLLGGQRRRKP